MQKLNADIWDFYKNELQTKDIYRWKISLYKRLFEIFSQYFPNSNLYLVGSSINGCASKSADLDLCFHLCKTELDRELQIEYLGKIKAILEENWDIFSLQLLRAKVPILRGRLKSPGYLKYHCEIDININHTVGVYNSHLLHYYAQLDKRFPAMVLVVKRWAKNAGINDPSKGSINTYSLVLMVLHYLQIVRPPVLPNLQRLFPDRFSEDTPLESLRLYERIPPAYDWGSNNGKIVTLLLGFFHYYNFQFPFQSAAISIRDACTIPKTNIEDIEKERYFIYILEPFLHRNTATSLTDPNEFVKVRMALKEAFDILHQGGTLQQLLRLQTVQ